MGNRTPNETEALPEALRLPIAIADDLVDPSVLGGSASTNANDPASTAFLHPDGHRSKDAGGAGVDAGGKGGEVIPGMVSFSVHFSVWGPRAENCPNACFSPPSDLCACFLSHVCQRRFPASVADASFVVLSVLFAALTDLRSSNPLFLFF